MAFRNYIDNVIFHNKICDRMKVIKQVSNTCYVILLYNKSINMINQDDIVSI